jgi:hypothetical protein
MLRQPLDSLQVFRQIFRQLPGCHLLDLSGQSIRKLSQFLRLGINLLEIYLLRPRFRGRLDGRIGSRIRSGDSRWPRSTSLRL